MEILARIFQNGELYLVMALQGFILEPGNLDDEESLCRF